ncbi:MAG: hypothetical protein GWP06_18370 [Actinobacteria bacterium]|nr:hypothetical protein [Actinomycetota bacterium]
MRHYFLIFFFVIFLPAYFGGCYTSFRHPLVEDDSGLGEAMSIRASDNCMECHQESQLFDHPVLPDAAMNDYNWYFYTQSAWWEGDENYDARYSTDDNSETPLPTGYRHPVGGGVIDTPYNTIVPSVTVPSSLGKAADNGANDASSDREKDSRRGFDRRKDTQHQPGKKTRSSKRKRK